MSENTKIEWADHTFNPWEGCTKVGPGCDDCYAETRNARFAGGASVNWGAGASRRRTSAANWRKPIAWNAAADAFRAEQGRRQRVFCASLADVFDNEVDPQWRFDLMRLIEQTPNLDWLLLTKRIGNAAAMLDDAVLAVNHGRWNWRDNAFPNVWIGATIVNQEEADRDIPKLLAVPAARRFVSIEPLLGHVDIRQALWSCCGNFGVGAEYMGQQEQVCCGQPELRDMLDWVIVGGESGAGARPMHPDWARSLRDQCAAADMPFLFKQWGEWLLCVGEDQRLHSETIRGNPLNHTPAWPDGSIGHGDFRRNGGYGAPLLRVGKRAAGRLLDGVQHDEFPRSAA